MLEITRQNLRKVISNVLESMFFIFIEPVSAGECARDLTGVNFHQVQIILTGPRQKLDLDFFFAASLAEQMAANFLGVEICDINNLQVLDVLKEMVNMVAGGLGSETRSFQYTHVHNCSRVGSLKFCPCLTMIKYLFPDERFQRSAVSFQ